MKDEEIIGLQFGRWTAIDVIKKYKNGKTYIEFIITSNYLEHIKVQCDENGVFVPGGDIIFPTGWDTEEKKERTVLKSYKFIKQEPLQVRKQEPVQLSIFDFIAN